MLRILALLLFVPLIGRADPVQNVVEEYILPGFGHLERKAAELNAAARSDCSPQSDELRNAYHETFDAWIAVSHLRFGPSETDNRAFALAFWPDTKGATRRTLARLIAQRDPIVKNPEEFEQVSVAARGLYALEQLLYSAAQENAPYECDLVRAIAHDISTTSSMIAADWRTDYAQLMLTAGTDGNPRYFATDEAIRELFTSLVTGVEFVSKIRLGRPLGTYDRPRPSRADAHRSGRSLRNITVSLQAMKPLALELSAGTDPATVDRVTYMFDRAIQRAERLDDPVFSGVAHPLSRIRVEALQVAVNGILEVITTDLGPAIGVAGGFNSLDGD